MMKLARILMLLTLLPAMALAADSPSSAPPASATSATPGMIYVAGLRNGFTVQFDHRQVLQDTSRLYLTSAGDNYMDVPSADILSLSQEQLPPPPPPPSVANVVDVKTAVANASDKHLVDADLIDSVIRAESNFNPKAVSPKGARGLMQLMPDTASKLGVQDSFDTQANVDGGTRYLRELLARYHNDLAKALAAYNAGPHRVEQYRGVPPYRETRAYVATIIRDFNRKKLAARKLQAKKTPPAKSQSAAVAHRSLIRDGNSQTRTTLTSPVPGS